MKKIMNGLWGIAVLAFSLLFAVDANAGFRVSQPSAAVRMSALMSLQDVDPISEEEVQNTSGEEPFTIDFEALGIQNPMDAYVLLVNEDTGNAVELSVSDETDTVMAIPPLVMAELEMQYLGASPNYRCMVMSMAENDGDDDEIVDLTAVATSIGAVELPNFNYRDDFGEICETTIYDRHLVGYGIARPSYTLDNPDDAEAQARADASAEENAYYVYEYELPNGAFMTYDEEMKTDGADTVFLQSSKLSFNVTFASSTPAAAKTAVKYALNIWSSALSGTVPVTVSVTFTSLGDGILGCSYSPSAGLLNGVFYPESLYNQKVGADCSSNYDIRLEFNSNYQWYFGTDQNCGNATDFVTVMLHEICHGLGFFDSIIPTTGGYGYGNGSYPLTFDTLLYHGGSRLTSLTASSRKGAIVSNALYFDGPNAKAANGGSRVKLFAPTTYMTGSSVSHWDTDVSFKNKTFMRYAYGGYPFHVISGIKKGAMKDLGWELASDPDPVPPAPTGLTASKGTYVGKIYLEWTASSGASAYAVYGATSANGTYSYLGTVSSCYCYVNLSENDTTTHYYKVAGVNSSGQTGALSASASGYAKPVQTVSYVEVSGPATLSSGAYADYTCTAYYSDGTSANVSTYSDCSWTVPYGDSYVDLSGRRVTAHSLASSQTFTIRAQYGGKTDQKTVTITPQSISYSIAYNYNGGTKGSNNPASATYGTSFYVSAPTKSGYTFAGWTVSSGLNTSTAKWGTGPSPSTSISGSSVKCVNGASGNVYFINLRNTSGSVTLKANWTESPIPPNDNFANALSISGNSGYIAGSTVCATRENGEPVPRVQSNVGGSIWYTWTAPATGTVRFSTEGSSFDTVLAIYTGSGYSSPLSEVRSDDDGGPNQTSILEFSATARTTYRISIAGWKDKNGSTILSWSQGPVSSAPVFRFYSKSYKGHFFSIDETEKEDLIMHNANWKYEGMAYRAFKTQASGTTALYRFYSKGYRGHFFTIDADEAEVVKKNRNWEYEGVAYYVYPQEVDGSVPVFRFWNDRYRHHFYTINESEKDTLIATNPNWAYEGVAFYALPAETADSGLRSLKKSVSSAAVAVAGEETRSEGRIPGNGSSVAAESEASLRTATRADASSVGATAGDEGLADAAPWTLWTRDGTPIKRDGATELDAVVVESRLNAPDAAELRSAETAEGDALLAETPPVELSLRLSGAPATRNATLWSASDGTVSEDDFDGTLDFDLPATGVWHWLRVADDSGNESISVWLRATAD